MDIGAESSRCWVLWYHFCRLLFWEQPRAKPLPLMSYQTIRKTSFIWLWVFITQNLCFCNTKISGSSPSEILVFFLLFSRLEGYNCPRDIWGLFFWEPGVPHLMTGRKKTGSWWGFSINNYLDWTKNVLFMPLLMEKRVLEICSFSFRPFLILCYIPRETATI